MNPSACLVAATELTPERLGRGIGEALVLLLFLLGILKCLHIMRRPATHKLAVSALLVALIGWLLAAAGSLFQVHLRPFATLLGVLGVLLMLAGLVLGIVGLATYDRNRYQQGRAQALWAVVLGALVVLVMLGGMGFGVFKAIQQRKSATHPTAAGKAREIPEFNFAVTPPARWVELKPEAVNKLACLALRRANPEIYCIVIGERLAGSLELEQLREIAKANLASASRVLRQSEETVSLNGTTFARIRTQAQLESANLTLEYEHWLATRRGFSWQFVIWAKQDDAATLPVEARALMETFRVLDPALDGAGKGTLKDVRRPEFGYRTQLEGLGWANWNDPDGNALMDFRAAREHEALVVLPLRFDPEPPDLDALTRGLLATLDFQHTPEEELESQPWTPGHGGTGRELQTERDVDGNRFHYILRVARGKDSAHLIAGWAAVAKGDLDLVRRSLDAITLDVPQGAAPALKPARKKALGLLLNNAAISLLDRDEDEAAADWFFKGFEQANDPIMLGNVGEALECAKLYAAGRDRLAPYMDRFPNHHALGMHFARLQALSGEAEAGSATFLRLLEHGLKDEDKLLSWLTLLTGLEQYPPALRCAEAWVARHPSANVRRWQAQTYAASGDPSRAITLLEKLRQENPKDSKVALDLGRYYNDAGEHLKAATVAEELLLDGKESPRALVMLGWSQMGRKWYRDAKASFERAAKQQPDDTDIQDAIRSASAALGQGDNSGIKDPLEPIPLPPEVQSALAAHPAPPAFGAGHPAAWLLRSIGYHFEKGKPLRRTIRRRVLVNTTEGAKEFSSVEVRFDPLGERIFMNRLEVKDPAGKTVAQASLHDAYVRDLDNDTASHDKVLHMQVAGVQPGTTVEWEVTIEDRGSSDSFSFRRHLFANSLPVAAEAVFVTGAVSALPAELAQAPGLKKIRSAGLAAWIAPPQAATPAETCAVPVETRCPMLWLGGEPESWAKVGNEYLKQLENRLTVEEPVKQLAASLVADKTPERDRIAAIARHVQRQIGYKAIEFGVRARRPNSAADTLRLRYGDCKDTALLLHLLLRAAGITSHLALVNTDWLVQPALPTLDQFNHMVVEVPALGPNWLLDATDKSLALALFPADDLWHAQALVLDPAGPRLMPVPAPASPAACGVDSHRTVTVEGQDWRVQETLALTGYYAAWMRGAFTGCTATEQRAKAQNILAQQGAVQVHEFRFENLEEIGEPARLTLSYAVRDGINAGNGHHSGALPALWERDYLDTQFMKERTTPFEWIYPLHFTSEVTVRLPAPAEAEALAALTRQAQSEFGSWSLKPETRGNEVVLHFDFAAKSGTYPAARYAAFHEGRDGARRVWDKPLSWRTK